MFSRQFVEYQALFSPSRQFTWNVMPYFLKKKKSFRMFAAVVTGALRAKIFHAVRVSKISKTKSS